MDEDLTPPQALGRAVLKLGSQARLARLLGVAQPSVWKWLDRGKPLPAEHVLKVEQSTGVSRHLLRPDIYPADKPLSAAAPVVDCERLALSHRSAIRG